MESTHWIFIHLVSRIYLSSFLTVRSLDDRASKSGKLPDALKKDYGYDAVSGTRTGLARIKSRESGCEAAQNNRRFHPKRAVQPRSPHCRMLLFVALRLFRK